MRSGGLTFPKTPDVPVIMVGPGTGVAPFRAAIQERVAQGETGEQSLGQGGGWLSPASAAPGSGPSPCLPPPRKRAVLRLPPAGPGFLLGSRVEAAAGEGLPDSGHGLLPRAGVCQVGGREGHPGRRLRPPPAPALAPRSRRCTSSTGSGRLGRWCGSCCRAGAPTSTWQGEPGPRVVGGMAPWGRRLC